MHGLPYRMMIEGLIYSAGCLLAFWRGGSAERIVAGALLAEFVVGLGVRVFDPIDTPHYLHLGLDAGVLCVLIFVAFSTDFRWPLLASALQILSVLTYVARIIDPSIHSWAFVTVSIALGYGVVLTVLLAALFNKHSSYPRQLWKSSP